MFTITGSCSWDRTQLGHVSRFHRWSWQQLKSSIRLQTSELYQNQWSHGLCWPNRKMDDLFRWRLYCLRCGNTTVLPESPLKDDNQGTNNNRRRKMEFFKLTFKIFSFVATNIHFDLTFILINNSPHFGSKKMNCISIDEFMKNV